MQKGKCSFCGGIGFKPVKDRMHTVLIDCTPCKEVNRERRKSIAKNKENIYESADKFMNHEAEIQWRMDYPDKRDILEARGLA